MTLRNAAGGAILAILSGVGFYFLYDKLVDRPVGSDSVIADVSPIVKRAPVVPVTIKAPVKTYQGNTKKNLKLPAEVQADPQQQVIAANVVQPELRPQTVSTVINTETGKVDTYVKTDPYPWFAIETRGVAQVAYGFKYDIRRLEPKTVARLHVGYDVIRVKALTAGVVATLDSDQAAFVGVGVSYRW